MTDEANVDKIIQMEQLLEENNHSENPVIPTYPFTTLSADLEKQIRRHSEKKPTGREIEDSYNINFVDDNGKIVKTHTIKRVPMLSEFGQQERIEILKNAYLYNRGMMLRTIRRIIRLYTHPDKNDIQLFVQDEMVSCSKFFNRLEKIAKLLFEEIENPIALDIYDEFMEFNFEKAFKIEAQKETVQNPITNADILEKCEKSKIEIINMVKTLVEKREKSKLPNIIQCLIDEGQLKQEPDAKTGKYILFKTPTDFFDWCFEHGYGDKINAAFVAEYIKTSCSLDTLKKYERDARDISDVKRKTRKMH
jgi:hypothetical protein